MMPARSHYRGCHKLRYSVTRCFVRTSHGCSALPEDSCTSHLPGIRPRRRVSFASVTFTSPSAALPWGRPAQGHFIFRFLSWPASSSLRPAGLSGPLKTLGKTKRSGDA